MDATRRRTKFLVMLLVLVGPAIPATMIGILRWRDAVRRVHAVG